MENSRNTYIFKTDIMSNVWMPAHIQWQTEGESFVLIPTRYPFSEKQDDLLALSRKTEWETSGENRTEENIVEENISKESISEESTDSYIGYGQRLLVTDVADYPLMDIRNVLFESVSDEDN